MRFALPVALLATVAAAYNHIVNQTTCGGTTYQYTGLQGYGSIPSNARDKYGDTIGGKLKLLRNTNGTLNFHPRIQKFQITLKLAPKASAQNPSKPNLNLNYLDTILLYGPDGQPTTGLDADVAGSFSYPGFPEMPVATYTGDGFGGEGAGGRRIAIDPEGLALATDGGFWISDEYGPYVCKFNSKGRMEHAIQPPQAILPRRNNTVSFSSDSAPTYDPSNVPHPKDTVTGRANSQGLEGLTTSADGKTLYTLMQSALDQEGGPKLQNKQPARLLAYDISGRVPRYIHEWVVMLPKYLDYTETKAGKEWKVAAQSEIHQLPTGDFLVLSRDSDFGHGQSESRSVYRHADVFSMLGNSSITDFKGLKNYDTATGAIASSKGVLKSGIIPVEYCSFLDYNVNSELAKFGLHNGGDQDENLLNEKWESLALVPVDPQDSNGRGKKEYFLFSMNDNDFITQDGYMNGGDFAYKDSSGFNLDTQVLVFKVEF
ncbi:secreted protein [Penicillium longicatenatum]|nr:secreted protein [Penicillium longicatenatum]